MKISFPRGEPISLSKNKKQNGSDQNLWIIPAGRYRAVLRKVTRGRLGLRLDCAVKVPGRRSLYLVGKNYAGEFWENALAHTLLSCRKRLLTRRELRTGCIETDDFIGKEVDILIIHIPTDLKYPFPYVKAICPPGTLVKE